jgi:hypothetical protein
MKEILEQPGAIPVYFTDPGAAIHVAALKSL